MSDPTDNRFYREPHTPEAATPQETPRTAFAFQGDETVGVRPSINTMDEAERFCAGIELELRAATIDSKPGWETATRFKDERDKLAEELLAMTAERDALLKNGQVIVYGPKEAEQELATLRTALATAEARAKELENDDHSYLSSEDQVWWATCLSSVSDKARVEIRAAMRRIADERDDLTRQLTEAQEKYAVLYNDCEQRLTEKQSDIEAFHAELSQCQIALAEAQSACAAKDEALLILKMCNCQMAHSTMREHSPHCTWAIADKALRNTTGADLLKRLADAEKERDEVRGSYAKDINFLNEANARLQAEVKELRGERISEGPRVGGCTHEEITASLDAARITKP